MLVTVQCAEQLQTNNLNILLVFFSDGLRQKASPYLGMAAFSSLPSKKNPEQSVYVFYLQFLSMGVFDFEGGSQWWREAKG